jgi:oligoribonuclease NrnB/cAMP/cGMP phosphodiesterase (DHH superfamily)
MALYPKIDDESILLDNECKRMLRRTSRKIIIDEVLEKLFNEKKNDEINLSESIKNSPKNKISLYELILSVLGCYK